MKKKDRKIKSKGKEKYIQLILIHIIFTLIIYFKIFHKITIQDYLFPSKLFIRTNDVAS